MNTQKLSNLTIGELIIGSSLDDNRLLSVNAALDLIYKKQIGNIASVSVAVISTSTKHDLHHSAGHYPLSAIVPDSFQMDVDFIKVGMRLINKNMVFVGQTMGGAPRPSLVPLSIREFDMVYDLSTLQRVVVDYDETIKFDLIEFLTDVVEKEYDYIILDCIREEGESKIRPSMVNNTVRLSPNGKTKVIYIDHRDRPTPPWMLSTTAHGLTCGVPIDALIPNGLAYSLLSDRLIESGALSFSDDDQLHHDSFNGKRLCYSPQAIKYQNSVVNSFRSCHNAIFKYLNYFVDLSTKQKTMFSVIDRVDGKETPTVAMNKDTWLVYYNSVLGTEVNFNIGMVSDGIRQLNEFFNRIDALNKEATKTKLRDQVANNFFGRKRAE